jgi:hypothetical protein
MGVCTAAHAKGPTAGGVPRTHALHPRPVPADDPELEEVLEDVLNEEAGDDAHRGREGRGANALSLESALVDSRGDHERGHALQGQGRCGEGRGGGSETDMHSRVRTETDRRAGITCECIHSGILGAPGNTPSPPALAAGCAQRRHPRTRRTPSRSDLTPGRPWDTRRAEEGQQINTPAGRKRKLEEIALHE